MGKPIDEAGVVDSPVPGHRNYLVYGDESGIDGQVYYGFASLWMKYPMPPFRLDGTAWLPAAESDSSFWTARGWKPASRCRHGDALRCVHMAVARPPIDMLEPSVISEVTRRDLFDAIRLEGIAWSGRFQDNEFLSRIFDLTKMPSTDHRHKTAAGDIFQHRVRNDDWDAYWVFTDERFNLTWCPDQDLLRFLAETLHPVVRAEPSEVDRLAGLYNEHLSKDGWELYVATLVAGSPVFAGRRRDLHLDHAATTVKAAMEPLGAEYVSKQIARMYAAVDADPDLAIGTAKELLETVCKAIVAEHAGLDVSRMELPALVKATTKQLRLAPEDVPEAARSAETIRVLLHSLGTIAGKLAELRNLYGTGHGKDASARLLEPRHARLAVGAAATLVTFLFDTHQAMVRKK